MIRRVTAFGLLLLLSLMVEAHEFWLWPSKFRYALNEELKLEFMVGENFVGESWDLKTHKIEKLSLLQQSGEHDVLSSVQPSGRVKFALKMSEPGTALFALQSNNSFIELTADKFNEYLREDGLENVLEERKKSNSMNKPSKELFARFVKLLVQVGGQPDDTFKKKTGLRIEIVPLQNPYVMTTGDYLQCLVLFEGKIVPHQLVKVWNKMGNTTFLQDIYTQDDGTIKFPFNAAGQWMVSTVKMIHAEQPGADWQSLWSSLVFEVK